MSSNVYTVLCVYLITDSGIPQFANIYPFVLNVEVGCALVSVSKQICTENYIVVQVCVNLKFSIVSILDMRIHTLHVFIQC